MTTPASSKAAKAAKSNGQIHLVRSGSVTVKIYECHKKGRDYFTVSWHIGPKRHRQNFKTLDEAKAFAKAEAEKLATGHVHAPTISPAEAQVFREAMRVAGHLRIPLHMMAAEYVAAASRISGIGSLGEAAEFYARNCPKVDEHRTVADVIEEFVERKRHDGLSARYLEDVRDRLAAFARSFRTPIFTIRARDIDDWLISLKVASRTRNNYRALLSTLFSFAQKRGYLPADRLHEVQRVDRAKVKGGAIEIYSPAELAEMLAAAHGAARTAIALGAFTGIRQAEMLRLDWSDFNWEEEVIDLGIDQTKTASRRLVPILPPLIAWIGNDRRTRGRFLPFGEDTAFFRAYRRVVHGVNAKRDEGCRNFRWKHNALRHSYASYRLAMVEDVAKVSLEMGNSPQKVFSNYRKVVTKSQATAWFAVMPVVPENVVPMSAVA